MYGNRLYSVPPYPLSIYYFLTLQPGYPPSPQDSASGHSLATGAAGPAGSAGKPLLSGAAQPVPDGWEAPLPLRETCSTLFPRAPGGVKLQQPPVITS